MKTLLEWLKLWTDPTCPDCARAIKKLTEMQNDLHDDGPAFRLKWDRDNGRTWHIGILDE